MSMQTTVHPVKDIDQQGRQVLENLLGHPLQEEQQIVIGVVGSQGKLPAWCNVYEGLSENEVAELEHSILQRS